MENSQETNQEPNQETVEVTSSKSSKQFIIIGVASAIVAIGIILFFSLGGEKDEVAVQEIVEAPKPRIYLKIDEPIITELTDPQGSAHHMLVKVSILSRDKAINSYLKSNLPLIKNSLLNLYGVQDYVKLQGLMHKKLLRVKSKKAINKLIKESGNSGEVEAVYFTKFIMD